jgi:hypothetical protein
VKASQQKNAMPAETPRYQTLISDILLRQIIGALWIIDGLLQLQPQMFTMNMVNGVMQPNIQGQPGPIAANLNWIIALTTHYLTAVNWGITLIQLAIGLCLLFGRWVKPALIVSVIWAVIVWYAGEGLSLMLTGRGSILTGAPGSVVLYALLAFVLFPKGKTAEQSSSGIISRPLLRKIFAGFWIFAALLQLQPYWWQSGQIAQEVSGLASPGTLSGIIIDPTLKWLSGWTNGVEVPVNIALVVVFLALGVGIFLSSFARLRPWLVASIIVSLIVWWFNQALGMILTGMATDPNSGPLLILIALCCWPVIQSVHASAQQKPTDASDSELSDSVENTSVAQS